MKFVIGVMRPRFLLLALACVFLGVAVAIWTDGKMNIWHVVLCLVGGVLAHGAVNAFNEYEDIKSGLDMKTNRTPFSGGSGTLVPTPEKVSVALWTGIIGSLICAAIGIYFYTLYGWPILLLGLLGLITIITYTPWLNKLPLLCLLAPGFGFGTLMVNATYFALTGHFSWAALIASFVPFFLVSNLLLLNQFPDADVDKGFGRRHFPILIGRKASAVIFTLFLAGTYLTIILGILLKFAPPWTLLGMATIIMAVPTARGALKNADDLPKLMPSLGQNVLLNLITPVLMAIGFIIG